MPGLLLHPVKDALSKPGITNSVNPLRNVFGVSAYLLLQLLDSYWL